MAAGRKKSALDIEGKRSREREYYANNKEKLKLKNKASYKKNAEARREYAAKRRVDMDKEKIMAYQAKYREENRERAKEYAKKYRESNQEQRRVYNRNRKAKLRTGGKLSVDIVKTMFVLQKGLCPCCKNPLGNDYHIDHIYPVSAGGENVDYNVQLLKSTCNLKKKAKHPIDYMQENGFLL